MWKKDKHRFTGGVQGIREMRAKEELRFLQLLLVLAFCTFLYCCMVYIFSVYQMLALEYSLVVTLHLDSVLTLVLRLKYPYSAIFI